MTKSIDLVKKHKSIDHISNIGMNIQLKNFQSEKRAIERAPKPDEKIEEKKKVAILLINKGTQTEAADFKKAIAKYKIFPKDIRKAGAQSVQEKNANSISTRSESESRASVQGRVYKAILRY